VPPKLDRCVTQIMDREDMKKKYPDEKERQSHAFAICNASVKSDETGEWRFLAEIPTDGAPWVQILPERVFRHPVWGEIPATKEMLSEMVQNFTSNARGIDIAINFAHGRDTAKGDQAAGWFKEVEHRPGSGLWGKVQWTPDAQEEIKQGKWRYLSAEYHPEWERDDGQKFKNVLVGAALTNKPFVKNMAPVNFSEFLGLQDELDEIELQAGSTDDPTSLHLMGMMKAPKQRQVSHLTGAHSVPAEDVADGGVDDIAEAHAKAHGKSGARAYDEMLGYELAEELNDGIVVLRDVSTSERKAASSSDFAGKGTSFPILKCEDVGAAFSSLGRAGNDNYSTGQIRGNIIRIAKRKGFERCLPESAKMTEEGGEEVDRAKVVKTLKLDENATDEQIEARIKELVEPDDKTRKFAEEYPEEHARLLALAEKDRKRDADEVIRKLHDAGMAPAADDKVRAVLLGEKTIKLTEDGKEKEVPVTFGDVLLDVVKTGIVDKSNRGGKGEKRKLEDVEEDFAAKVNTFMEEENKAGRKIDFMEAAKKVGEKEPELYNAWLSGAPSIGATTD
jgi:hypothetical protein